MPKDWSYDLRVRGTVPRDLSLESLGELAKHLASLLGAEQHVRFAGLVQGSARIRAAVLEDGISTVQANVVGLRLLGLEHPKVIRLNDYLRQRGWYAELRNRDGAVLLNMPGALAANEPEHEVRIVRQVASVVGSVIKIGGRDESVPMQLRLDSGEYLDVTVKGRDRARELAPHLFGDELRFTGLATWRRDQEGAWRCETMLVESFETLDGRPLEALFAELGDVPGNGWKGFDDPIDEMARLRGGE